MVQLSIQLATFRQLMVQPKSNFTLPRRNTKRGGIFPLLTQQKKLPTSCRKLFYRNRQISGRKQNATIRLLKERIVAFVIREFYMYPARGMVSLSPPRHCPAVPAQARCSVPKANSGKDPDRFPSRSQSGCKSLRWIVRLPACLQTDNFSGPSQTA